MTVWQVWLVIFLLLSGWADAQGFYYISRNITTTDGLASDHVHAILQDRKGYIWIATENGLQRYDGYTFTDYHHRPFDANSLSSDLTSGLTEDREGRIWTTNALWGFSVLDPATDHFTKINDTVQRVFRSLNNSTGMCQDDQGNVWLMSLNSLAAYDIVRHRLLTYDSLLPPGEDMGFTNAIRWDGQMHCLWLNSSTHGVCLFDPIKKAFYWREHNPFHWPALQFNEGVGMLFLDRERGLWVNTYSGRMLRCSLADGKWTEYYFDGKGITDRKPLQAKPLYTDCFLQDRSGSIWIGIARYGLVRYRPGIADFVLADTYPLPGEVRAQEAFTCLFEDKDGDLWVGSDKGIHVIYPSQQQFTSVPLVTEDGTPAPDYSVANFLETKGGDIWVATLGGGIFVYDQRLKLKKVFFKKTPADTGTAAPGEPENRIWSLCQRPDGKIWIGCQHGWLSEYDERTGKFSNSQPKALDKRTIISMAADGPDVVWLALYDGFARWDARDSQFVHYREFLPFRGTSHCESVALVAGKDKRVWIGTLDHGLQAFDADARRFTDLYVHRNGDPGSLSSISIQSVIPIGDSLLGLGTYDGGIDLFDLRTRKALAITTEDGMPSNTVSALWYRRPWELWAATIAGLCRVDLRTRRVTRYGEADGVVSKEFGDLLGFYGLRDGRVLAGYKGGFVSFYPDSLLIKHIPGNVRITGVGVFEHPLRLDSALRGSDTLCFSYRQNFITLQYATLSYRTAADIRYYYRLDGIDKDWVDAGTRRYASFTNLPTGHYTFRVRSADKDGNFSPGITTLVIVIRAPFWQTWWFYALVVVFTATIAFCIYRYNLLQERRVAAIRNKISRDLHDDLGATLSSITVLSDIARTRIEEGNPEQSFPLLVKIRAYSGEMVGKMRDIVWAIDPRNDTLREMIQRLRQYGAEWSASREMLLRFTAADEFLQVIPPMNVRKNLYLICKEATYNAVRHSGADVVIVNGRMTGDILEMEIEDNGRGFDPAKRHMGNGLVNMRARAAEIGAVLTIRSSVGKTSVRLRMKVPKIRD